MPVHQAPSNYQWVDNLLSYTLPSGTTGLKLKYKKQGTSDWIVIYESPFNAPSSINFPSSSGPTGTVWGVTREGSSGGWGNPEEEEINNTPT